MGTGECSSSPTVVLRLSGQSAIGPSEPDQSKALIRPAISPLPKKGAALSRKFATQIPRLSAAFFRLNTRNFPERTNGSKGSGFSWLYGLMAAGNDAAMRKSLPPAAVGKRRFA